MHYCLLAFCFAIISFSASGQKAINKVQEEAAIHDVLKRQEVAWNAGDLEAFMQGYWKSDSLMFIGKRITSGWQQTLDGYRKSYPTKEIMGKLSFTFYEFRFLSGDACMVTGRYLLKRASDEPTGLFTLLLRKINGSWVVVYDHTS